MDEINIVKFLSDELDEQEAEKVRLWIELPENKAEYEKILQLWQSAQVMEGQQFFHTEKSWEKMKFRMAELQKSEKRVDPSFRWWYAVAALIVLLVGGFFFFRYFTKTDKAVLQFAAQDDRLEKPVVLPDGTRIYLNRHTHVKLDPEFGDKTRTITLWGEAFFEVAKDKTKPFIIKAGSGEIKVVGTSFNVFAYHADSVQVAVRSGIVELYSVEKQKERLRLTVGNMGTLLSENNKLISTPSFDANINAWRTRQLSFKNADLDYVAKMLELAYGKHIDIENVRDKSFRWNLTINNLELDSVLKVVAGTNNMKVNRTGQVYFISGK